MKRFVFLGHRWLGIALSVLFVLWFVSGVVMMYVRMPILTPAERFAQLPRLDMARVRVAMPQAWKATGLAGAPKKVRLNTVAERPVYHFLPKEGVWTSVWADSGELVGEVSPELGAQSARNWAATPNARYIETVTGIDQWTLTNSLNLQRPLMRYALDDAAGTEVYVSRRTGEVVMRSTSSERLLSWIGPVMHWLAPEFFRQKVALWRGSLLWLSVAGTLLTLSGLWIGIVRLRRGGYRLRAPSGERVPSFTPYRGTQRGHHIAGLVFGAVTFTWIFSGLLYTNPGGTQQKPTSTTTQFTPYSVGGVRADTTSLPGQSEVLSGGAPLPALFGADVVQAWRDAANLPVPREIDFVRFGGKPYFSFADDWNSSRLVAASDLGAAALTSVGMDELIGRARGLAPNQKLLEATRLDSYDAYYYSVGNVAQKRLPVARLKFADGQWFYINLHDGSIFRRYDAHGRRMRWLINGLHCLDFPFLIFNRPAWDLTIILLSLGGLWLSLSGTKMGWRRLRGAPRKAPKTRSTPNVPETTTAPARKKEIA